VGTRWFLIIDGCAHGNGPMGLLKMGIPDELSVVTSTVTPREAL